MSRRAEIAMTGEEVRVFLAEQRTVVVTTSGPGGWPHAAPLWYVHEGTTVSGWTYAKSQKVRNLERDPRASLLVEAGDTYDELRGVLLRCDVEVVRETEDVTAMGMAVMRRHAPGHADPTPEVHDMVAAQAPKRVGLVFTPVGVASWDHRKLGRGY